MKIDKETEEQFKSELQTLLDNDHAEIYAILEGDTHGIYDEGVGVCFRIPKPGGNGWTVGSDTVRLTRGI